MMATTKTLREDVRPRESVSILLLEDDPAHADAVQRAFLDSGVSSLIRWARTLGEYKAFVTAQTPAIAIVDLQLPDGHSVDVLTSPLEAGPFPVLILSGLDDEHVAAKAMKAGAIEYVLKSAAAFAEMPRTVERCLCKWALIRARREGGRSVAPERIGSRQSAS